MKPSIAFAAVLTSLSLGSCHRATTQATSAAAASAPTTPTPAQPLARQSAPSAGKDFPGFDRNEYPGDDTMAQMHATFAFTGYWLTVPPGAQFNQWSGKRDLLRKQGWGFLVLANGKLEKEILAAQAAGVPAAALGQRDALAAVAAATAEGFPAHTLLFLDQEEGGRLTAPQAAYLLAWTEAVAASTYKAGVYASGQLTPDDPGTVIDTIRDIRERVGKGHLHPVEFFDAQDTCPPSNGCTVTTPPIATAGEPDVIVWQYSQSPRRPSLTAACATTYAADGNCYAPGFPKIFLDNDVATSPDPSHGR